MYFIFYLYARVSRACVCRASTLQHAGKHAVRSTKLFRAKTSCLHFKIKNRLVGNYDEAMGIKCPIQAYGDRFRFKKIYGDCCCTCPPSLFFFATIFLTAFSKVQSTIQKCFGKDQSSITFASPLTVCFLYKSMEREKKTNGKTTIQVALK